MKKLMLFHQKLFLALLSSSLFLLASCETESVENNSERLDITQESFKIIVDETAKTSVAAQNYFCSEVLEGYDSELYINRDVYISEFYIPDTIGGSPNRIATWMTNLESWLNHDFNDPNPSGSNSYSIFMEYQIYNVNGSTIIPAVEANRAYNEFVCQLMSQLSISDVNDINNFELDLDIYVDYLLCGCNNPTVSVTGVAYY
ncbi:hypothetical protein ACFO3O_16595 [Dokdonia ponticola]|uniref:DUF4377 domain-containing protein n=1 Tax=Dokdonia ponticola TaxID=2041041 RepID=A0ABV9HZD2_9FLAO